MLLKGREKRRMPSRKQKLRCVMRSKKSRSSNAVWKPQRRQQRHSKTTQPAQHSP